MGKPRLLRNMHSWQPGLGTFADASDPSWDQEPCAVPGVPSGELGPGPHNLTQKVPGTDLLLWSGFLPPSLQGGVLGLVSFLSLCLLFPCSCFPCFLFLFRLFSKTTCFRSRFCPFFSPTSLYPPRLPSPLLPSLPLSSFASLLRQV